jgi:hypothetical protein
VCWDASAFARTDYSTQYQSIDDMLCCRSFQALNAEIIEFLFATTEPSTEQKTTRHRRITRLTFGTNLHIQFEAAVCAGSFPNKRQVPEASHRQAVRFRGA